jgi:hypothetical protein
MAGPGLGRSRLGSHEYGLDWAGLALVKAGLGLPGLLRAAWTRLAWLVYGLGWAVCPLYGPGVGYTCGQGRAIPRNLVVLKKTQ